MRSKHQIKSAFAQESRFVNFSRASLGTIFHFNHNNENDLKVKAKTF